jgi:hypothetical protein
MPCVYPTLPATKCSQHTEPCSASLTAELLDLTAVAEDELRLAHRRLDCVVTGDIPDQPTNQRRRPS